VVQRLKIYLLSVSRLKYISSKRPMSNLSKLYHMISHTNMRANSIDRYVVPQSGASRKLAQLSIDNCGTYKLFRVY
jgi:hypothetical protein